MQILFQSPLLLAAALTEIGIVAVWLWQQVLMNRIHREGLRVSVEPGGDSEQSVTVIIPAKNEAERIGETLRHLLEQNHDNLRIIISDDRSDDGTAQVASGIAANDPRVSILRIDALPPQWMGKSHAMWHAAKQVDSDWLLFIDADCHILPNGLVSALRYANRRKADLLSLWPRDGSVGFWERLLLPLCGAMIVIWYGRSTQHGGGPVSFANGQFLLVRRDAYWAVGGHESVRDRLIEDIPFAERLQAAGHHVVSAIGADVCSVRMYDSLRELVRGWQRIYIGVLTPAQIALCMLSIVVGSLVPYVTVPYCLHRVCRGDGVVALTFLVLGGIHLAALMATSIRFFSIAYCRLRYLWLYPLSCLGVLAILAGSLVRRLRRTTVEWRGTRYDVRSSRIE